MCQSVGKVIEVFDMLKTDAVGSAGVQLMKMPTDLPMVPDGQPGSLGPTANNTPLSTCTARDGSGMHPAAWSHDARCAATGAALANKSCGAMDLPNLERA